MSSLLKDINEIKAPENDWGKLELAAWKERFPKAKSSTVEEFRKEFPKHQYRRQDDVVSLKLGESSLMQELSVTNAPPSVQTALKKVDGTDAGANDVVNKTSAADVSFSLMRNTINADGNVSGSDVADYIERAEELNDEVDTVPFGLETDDGQIVKVYVNAEQADKFEEAMKQMLGLEDDIEEAINRLTTQFDIVDVVWPTTADKEDGEEVDPDADLSIDDADAFDDFGSEDDYDVVGDASASSAPAAKAAADDAEEEDEIAKAAAEDAEDEDDEAASAADDAEEEDEEETDEDGKPKKKKKKAQPAEPADDDEPKQESLRLEDKEADSPSQAAAVKLMTSKGLHIAAMSEHEDGTVYIEDSQGDEYVLRGDKRLTKEKHGKKLMSLKKEDLEQEKNMTSIGSKFLARVLGEGRLDEAAAEDRDGVKDGFNIPLDSQARALAAKLRLPFAKRLIAFHYMAGVPGRYLNTEDVESTIVGAADMLRKKVAVRKAFLALYDGLANAKGFTIPQETTNEAKGEYTTYAAWKRAVKAKHPEVWFDGDKDIAQAMVGENPYKRGKTKSVGEWDGAKGEIYPMNEDLNEAKAKRGSFIQKLFETVLIELGLPESLVTTTGPSAVGTGIYRTAELIEQDSTLERALRVLATRMGIKNTEAAEPVAEGKKPVKSKADQAVTVQGVKGMKSKPFTKTFKNQAALEKWMDKNGDDVSNLSYSYDKIAEGAKFNEEGILIEQFDWKLSALEEAVDVGNDDFAEAVVSLVAALGIPDDVLQRRRTQIIQALRQKKQTLRNRAQIMTMIKRTQDVITKNVAPRGGQQDQDTTNEGIQLDEAAKLKAFKVTVPEVNGLKGKALEAAIFGEDEGDDSYIMNQDVVTVEYVKLKGNTLYIYPMLDTFDETENVDRLQKRLQAGVDRWAAKMNKRKVAAK